MIKFPCQTCGKKLGAPDRYAGRKVICPSCGRRSPVPDDEVGLALDSQLVLEAAQSDAAGLEADAGSAEAEAGAAAGRRCPSCGKPVGEGHVLCTNCGQPLRPGMKRPETVFITEKDDRAVAGSSGGGGGGTGVARSAAGLIVATIVAGVFSLIWVVLTLFTGYEFGIVAWAIGGLVGLTAGAIARNPSPVFGSLTALVALGSILGAKFLMAALIFLTAFGVSFLSDIDAFSPEAQKLYHATLDDMLADGVFDGLEQEIAQAAVTTYFEGEYVEPPDVDWQRYAEANEAIEEAVAARLEAMSEQERTAVIERARQRHPGWIEDHNLYLAVVDELLNEELLTPELEEHARSELAALHGGDYDTEYFETTSMRDQENRGRELRHEAAGRIADMSAEQRAAALDAARERHPRWIADETLHHAVLLQVVDEGVLTGDVQRVAQADIAMNMAHDWDQPVFEELDWERIEELRGEAAVAVNARILDMSAEQRAEAIAAASAAYPEWDNPLGIDAAEMEEIRHAFAEEGIDDTFGSAVRASFHPLDLLWIFLAVTSAFSVAVKQGEE